MKKSNNMIEVFYHKNCTDGKASALAAYTSLGETADYTAVSYYNKDPSLELLKGKTIYIVDFSYGPEYMLELCKVAKQVIVIDHHITAIRSLKTLIAKPPKNCTLILDVNHSGAYLTYQHFYPDAEVPLFFLMMEDYDLWIHKYPDSKFLVEYLYLSIDEWCPEKWLAVSTDMESSIENGKILYESGMQDAAKALNNSWLMAFYDGQGVYVVNAATSQASKIGEMAKINKMGPILIFYEGKYSCAISLRQGNSDVDLSVYAEELGRVNNCRGGGHPGSAGISPRVRFHQFKGLQQAPA